MPDESTRCEDRELTFRQLLQRELESGPLTCRELSQRVRQSEKEVLEHLEHLRLSLRQQGKRLVIDPAFCTRCGYLFEQRTRLAKPGKCPSCRHTGIEPPHFRVVGRPTGER